MIPKNILYSLPNNHFKGFNSDQQRLPGPVENLNLLWSSDGWHTWDKRYDKTANVASSYFSSKVFKSGPVLRELDRQWNILLICNLNIVWWLSKLTFISGNGRILWGANVSIFFFQITNTKKSCRVLTSDLASFCIEWFRKKNILTLPICTL